MKLSDCLDARRILVPLEGDSLEKRLDALLALPPLGRELGAEQRAKLARDLASGARGEIVELAPGIVAVLAAREGAGGTLAFLGVAPPPVEPARAADEEDAVAGGVRALIVILTQQRVASLGSQAVPALVAYLGEGDGARRLVTARTPDEVLELSDLLDVTVEEGLRVADAFTPVPYRVYPDTPLGEVVDLMVRRELRVVPVVGDNYQVRGVITSGDALRHVLPGRAGRPGESEGGQRADLVARDVMTRAVMCVSEDQDLHEAATLMVNRDVEALPVVCEGQFAGFLTRDTVLRLMSRD